MSSEKGEQLSRDIQALIGVFEDVAQAIRTISLQFPTRVTSVLENSNNSRNGKIQPLLIDTRLSLMPNSDTPFNIQIIEPEGKQRNPFHIPADQVMSVLGDAPIQGIKKFQVRDRRGSGSMRPTEIVVKPIKPIQSGNNNGNTLLPKGIYTRRESYRHEDDIVWGSQEELADIITGYMRLLQEILQSPIAFSDPKLGGREGKKVTITLSDIAGAIDVPIKNARALLMNDQTRKIGDLTPEFLSLLNTTLVDLVTFLQDEENKTRLIEKMYDKIYTFYIRTLPEKLGKKSYSSENWHFSSSFDCVSVSIHRNLRSSDDDDYNPALFRKLYTMRISERRITLRTQGGEEIKNFDVSDKEHRFSLLRHMYDTSMTDEKLRYQFGLL